MQRSFLSGGLPLADPVYSQTEEAMLRKAHVGLTTFLSLVILPNLSRAQQPLIDLKTLVGKKAIVQRMPLYKPGTFQPISGSYAGQEVTIIGFKPFAMPKVQLDNLSPQQKAAILDIENSGTLLVQFADGTKADTGMVQPSTLLNYLELEERTSSADTTRSTSIDQPQVSPTKATSNDSGARDAAQTGNIARTNPRSVGGKWTVGDVKDQLTDATEAMFLLYAEAPVSDGISAATPVLSIDCGGGRFRGGIFDAGIVIGGESHESTKFLSQLQPRQEFVRVRLDDKIDLMSWDVMDAKDSLAIGKRDMKKIVKTKWTRIEFPVFANGTAAVATFNTEGLNRHIFSKLCDTEF
jgi:hypothetical protein